MELISSLINDPELIRAAGIVFESFIRYFTYLYQWMIILAPILGVIYIIIGGMKFSASSGNRERLQSAKRTITAAIIGCVIVFLAYPVLNFIGYVFTPEGSEFHFLDWYADIVTLLALVYIGWGGIQYSASSGNPREILEAKRTIFYAVQGYVWMQIIRMIFNLFVK